MDKCAKDGCKNLTNATYCIRHEKERAKPKPAPKKSPRQKAGAFPDIQPEMVYAFGSAKRAEKFRRILSGFARYRLALGHKILHTEGGGLYVSSINANARPLIFGMLCVLLEMERHSENFEKAYTKLRNIRS